MSPLTFKGLAFFSCASAGATTKNAKITTAQVRFLPMFVSSSLMILFALLCLGGVFNGCGDIFSAFAGIISHRRRLPQVDVTHFGRLRYELSYRGFTSKIRGDELALFGNQDEVIFLQIHKAHITRRFYRFYFYFSRFRHWRGLLRLNYRRRCRLFWGSHLLLFPGPRRKSEKHGEEK